MVSYPEKTGKECKDSTIEEKHTFERAFFNQVKFHVTCPVQRGNFNGAFGKEKTDCTIKERF